MPPKPPIPGSLRVVGEIESFGEFEGFTLQETESFGEFEGRQRVLGSLRGLPLSLSYKK